MQREPIYTEDTRIHTSKLIHELRNSLTLLKGTLQVIEGTHSEVLLIPNWKDVNGLLLEMENLLQDTSLFHNCSTPNYSLCNLIEIIQNLYELYCPLAERRGVSFDLIINPDSIHIYQQFCCDKTAIRHALSNLIKNAIEACNQGDDTKIMLDVTNTIPICLDIRILDNGTYIDASILDTIFEPYVTYKSGGTGLGLAIVKKSIEAHNGNIIVTSNPEITCFQILLPIKG